MTDHSRKKLVFLGWDAADWQLIFPLIEQGRLPNLKRVMDQGAWGNLATLVPILSPMLWNSIATGKRPQKHSILGFIEPKPDGSGVRPVASTSRSARAFWNIFHNAGLRGHVINWFASHPAEPIDGVVVSNIFAALKTEGSGLAALPPQTVSPAALSQSISQVRVRPDQLKQEQLGWFLAPGAQIDPRRDNQNLGFIGKMVAEMSSVHSALMQLMKTEPWDYAAVYFGAIDHFCHRFIEYAAPQMPKISLHDFQNFREVVNECYVYHDRMLGETLAQAGEDAVLMICSDHGFLNGDLRPTHEIDPAAWHRFHGMVLLHGPGIAQGEELVGATLLDIAPTLLNIMGLPVGEDMDGNVLVQAFEQPPSIKSIPSWDDVPGDFGEHPPEMVEDPYEAQESLRQLIELGYIDAPEGDTDAVIEIAQREQQVNLAAAYQYAGQHGEAEKIWDEILIQYPDEVRFLLTAAECALTRRKFDKAIKLLDHCESKHGSISQIYLLRGHIEILQGNLEEASKHLEQAAACDDSSVVVQLKVGQLYRRKGEYRRALAAFDQLLTTDPDNPLGHAGRAEVMLKLKNYESSADAALSATERLFHLPAAHLTLGMAIARLGDLDQAIQCVEVAARQSPGWTSPHRLLALLYAKQGRHDDSNQQRETLQQLQLKFKDRDGSRSKAE